MLVVITRPNGHLVKVEHVSDIVCRACDLFLNPKNEPPHMQIFRKGSWAHYKVEMVAGEDF